MITCGHEDRHGNPVPFHTFGTQNHMKHQQVGSTLWNMWVSKNALRNTGKHSGHGRKNAHKTFHMQARSHKSFDRNPKFLNLSLSVPWWTIELLDHIGCIPWPNRCPSPHDKQNFLLKCSWINCWREATSLFTNGAGEIGKRRQKREWVICTKAGFGRMGWAASENNRRCKKGVNGVIEKVKVLYLS